ncbi:MAG: type IV pilus modification PilV family protein [Solirubrobacterales bacterium]
MRNAPAKSAPSAEQGFALLEVMVSAAVLLIASVGVIGLIRTTTHASGEERHGSEAYAVAQEDQARLRSMRLEVLNHYHQIREVPLNGTIFTVESDGVFVNDKTSKVSCSGNDISADYVQVTSKVTWPGMSNSEAAKIESIVSPTSQSMEGGHGTLTISATNEKGEPMGGLVLSGLGAVSVATNAEGCASFPDLVAGSNNYTLESSGAAANLVTKDGSSSEKTLVGVESNRAKKVSLLYDHPGTMVVEFKYRVGSSSAFEKATADSIVAFNSNMQQGKVAGTPGGSRLTEVKATTLFPFVSPYSVYAGSCASNNPNPSGETNPPGAAAIGSVRVPANEIAAPVTIQLPALELVVNKGGTALSGAKVTLTDRNCKEAKGNLVKRVYTTNQKGMPSSSASGAAELGLPWGVYEICASANISGSNRRKKISSATVQNLTAATVATIDLGSGTESGECT